MTVRRANTADIPRIGELLLQVHAVHSEHRPDIFKRGARKYNDEQLKEILSTDEKPVFVAVGEDDVPVGYAFCVWEEVKNDASLSDRKSLYIDDICIDSAQRGKGIGSLLYRHVVQYAKEKGAYHITLNVWCFNESALRFYEKCGMQPLKTVMEQKLGEN